MKRIGKIFIVAASLLLAACTSNEESKAKELVSDFYRMHQSARPSGALTLNELITFRHFLSVPLFNLLKDVSVAEEARAAQSAAAPLPPLLEGDIFTANPGGASTFRVVQCDMQKRESECSVELIYSDAKLKAPAKWVDKVLLTRDARGWIIDNIQYAGGQAPMRNGNLQDTLLKLLKRDAAPLQ
ncbi:MULTISPECIES: hypothetical protein [unclassified Herbaspirillum]|uniref:hypothetical protein n=1 Tax=unclassified Herbaspirillum TaxID=2624150 RepID=UPI00115234E5|nr:MULTISPECIES: hypothetical protein [unclassified Herbaspirillum]MBB5391471.1 hypothetical protein [Herbaspirillum sp. SJZ102]TQK12844.1 hypothetical protein FB599_0250 [Herbaspirillum sp. SJZ130]TQK14848.1 hypothetical protein FB598_0188 [Herbaspirillum sp. SJZ106]